MNRVVAIDKCTIINFMHINRFYLLKALGYSVITTVHVKLEYEEKAYPAHRKYFLDLVNQGEISYISLEIDDLVEMANVPQSKRASDAELSCLVVAQRRGWKAMTDDKKAIKYISRYISMPQGSVIGLVDVLLEAYLNDRIGDHELRTIQATLSANKFHIKADLVAEGARRRLMTRRSVE